MPPLPIRSSGLRTPTPLPRFTNIGTTVPPQQRLTRPATAEDAFLPTARLESDGPGEALTAPDPLWTSRWQPSKTVPLSKAPWVTGYRWWVAGVTYQGWGPDKLYRIDLMFKDGHKHAYSDIPKPLWEEFRNLRSSVGQWFHEKILGRGWRRGSGSLFPDWPL